MSPWRALGSRAGWVRLRALLLHWLHPDFRQTP
jgi:hypothetical protein